MAKRNQFSLILADFLGWVSPLGICPSRLNLGFFPNTILNDLAIDLQDIFGHPANESLELRQSWLLQPLGLL